MLLNNYLQWSNIERNFLKKLNSGALISADCKLTTTHFTVFKPPGIPFGIINGFRHSLLQLGATFSAGCNGGLPRLLFLSFYFCSLTFLRRVGIEPDCNNVQRFLCDWRNKSTFHAFHLINLRVVL